MKTETFESTYAMLVRSEEKERSITEIAIYALLILSSIFTIWNAAQQHITLPNVLGASSAQSAPARQPNI